MVQVGIFGTTGALDDQTTHMLLNEIITQCCEKLGSQQVHRIISHASGFGIAEYALELGKLKGAETLGMVLPSCKGRTWYPEHGITYIKEDGSEMEVVDQSKIMDIVLLFGLVTSNQKKIGKNYQISQK